jgi:hypothetical protein
LKRLLKEELRRWKQSGSPFSMLFS